MRIPSRAVPLLLGLALIGCSSSGSDYTDKADPSLDRYTLKVEGMT